MKSFKRFLPVGLLVLCAFIAFAPQASALTITPDSGVLNTSRWEGDDTSQDAINDIIEPIIGDSVELYKSDVEEGDPEESGPFAGSYQTEFFNTPSDPEDATITWVGPDFVGPIAYLLVKDGNADPAWYLFDLTALTWDGKSTLTLEDFWLGTGAISHVTLYGTRGSVPEPATMLLLGAGLLGLAGLGRKKLFK